MKLARKVIVNGGAALLALWAVTATGPLAASDAYLIGFLAAVLGTAVMEWG